VLQEEATEQPREHPHGQEESRATGHDPVWLEERGYDGLYAVEGPCGCGTDDFAPCGDRPFPECVPVELRDDELFHPAKRKRIVIRELKP
jgi:hypothetical protein